MEVAAAAAAMLLILLGAGAGTVEGVINFLLVTESAQQGLNAR